MVCFLKKEFSFWSVGASVESNQLQMKCQKAMFWVFPPFYWIFWGRKREKEGRKKGIVTAHPSPIPSTSFSFQSLKGSYCCNITQFNLRHWLED
jgi:hypothetical protein